MAYYATYDPATGNVIQLSSVSSKDDAPEPNIELSEEQWIEAMSSPKRVVDGQLADAPPDPPPPVSLDSLKRRKSAEIAAARYAEEIGGLEAGGLSIDTDDRSKILLGGAFVSASNDPSFTTVWKSKDGGFATLTAEQIIEAYNALSAFIERLFQKESELVLQVRQAETPEAVNAVSWTAAEN